MSTITITLQNKKFNLECAPEKHEQLLSIASKLDSEMGEILGSNSNISFELALVMLSLKLMAFKQSEVKIAGGDAMQKLEQDHNAQMNAVSEQLNNILGKLDGAV